MEQIIVEAPAKINLTLDVKGKRADGYHELETVMHQINLVDTIYLQPDSKISINSNSNNIPLNQENLAWRAAALLFNNYGLTEGVKIFIEKKIPVGAGLAGGSTDAAAVIKGINKLFNLRMDRAEQVELAGQIGSDVPFCIRGGTALARGRGEILFPLSSAVNLDMVLIKPDFQLSTAEVYRDLNLTNLGETPDNKAFLEAWENCDIIKIASSMANVLESVSIKKYSTILKIKQELYQEGALKAVMSGSGPSVFGIFTNLVKAKQAYQYMKRLYQEVYLVSSYNRGE